jgi:hypothetical protein
MIKDVLLGLAGFAVIVGVVYVLTRTVTLAHYRSKRDYDRGFRKFKGE